MIYRHVGKAAVGDHLINVADAPANVLDGVGV